MIEMGPRPGQNLQIGIEMVLKWMNLNLDGMKCSWWNRTVTWWDQNGVEIHEMEPRCGRWEQDTRFAHRYPCPPPRLPIPLVTKGFGPAQRLNVWSFKEQPVKKVADLCPKNWSQSPKNSSQCLGTHIKAYELTMLFRIFISIKTIVVSIKNASYDH